jgi:outer membrane protein assembly factor BamB
VDISADPEFYQGAIYAATFQGRVAAVDARSGRILWNRDMSSYAGLAVDESSVYVTDDQGQVWALDRFNGNSVWKQDKLRGRAVTGPTVYGSSVVVGDYQGYLHWLAKDDGRFLARRRVDSAGTLTPGVVAGDTLYVGGKGGDVVALRAQTGS